MREGVKMRRCEDEKMRYRPPLLEEPCAQTLSGKNVYYRYCKLQILNIINIEYYINCILKILCI